MSKLGNKELSSSLSDKHGLNKTDAEKFVAALFDVISEGLESDKLVKVKGLGTFKIIGVAARKSVDVNTGEPIVIEGRDKISFTPDATLRDEVNKPFSQFDTVVLNDGVDFSTIDKEFEEDPEAAVLKAIGETTAPEAPVLEPSNEEASNEKVAIEDVATKEEAEVPHSEEKSEIEEVHEAVEPSKENIPIVGSVESPSEESPIDKNPVVIEQHEEVEENKVEDKSAVEQPQYDEEIVEEIAPVKYALNPEDVSVWSIKDGCVRNDKGEPHKTIQDKRGLIRKNYFNEVMRQVMSDFNTLLGYDD